MAAGQLRLEFRLAGAGWADLHLSFDDTEHLIEGISYVTNALNDLLIAALRMAVDDQAAAVTFEGEPLLTTLEIARTRGPWMAAPCTLRCWETHYKQRQELFSTQIASADLFAQAVLQMTERLLEKQGIEGYEALWGMSPFPAWGLAALRAALAVEPRPWRWEESDG